MTPYEALGARLALSPVTFSAAANGEAVDVEDIELQVISLRGHTPGSVALALVDGGEVHLFTGDSLFMPDGGSARADFPGGDAGVLYDSIQKVLALPDQTRLFMCHDYGPNGRDIQWETTVVAEKAHNIHVGGGATREAFIKFRTERDATLAVSVNSDVPKDHAAGQIAKVVTQIVTPDHLYDLANA